jgi:hypothetical protein
MQIDERAGQFSNGESSARETVYQDQNLSVERYGDLLREPEYIARYAARATDNQIT